MNEHWTTDAPEVGTCYWFIRAAYDGGWCKPEWLMAKASPSRRGEVRISGLAWSRWRSGNNAHRSIVCYPPPPQIPPLPASGEVARDE